jgi:hypothetical protein
MPCWPAGVPAANLSFNTRPDGQHNEAFWRREFEAGFRFLYAAATPTGSRKRRGGLGFELYPNPAGSLLQVALPVGSRGGQVAIHDLTGRLVLKAAVAPGTPGLLDVGLLRQGQYVVQVESGGLLGWLAFSKE